MTPPTYVRLKLPPGVSRPGTVYDARGRWYDTQLVRWYGGREQPVLQAVKGWQPLLRTATQDVAAAISDNGGVFTDETADANDADAGDVVLVPSSPQVNDALYIGFGFRFQEVDITVSTAASDGAVTWEYWDGAAWTALDGVVDETEDFQAGTSTYEVAWDLPADWAKTTVNSQGPFYYVRARVTTAGTSQALGTAIDIGTGPVDLDEVVRGMKAWKTNANGPRLGLGTPTKLYVVGQGTLTDITPAGFTTGDADASQSSANYNSGAYGTGLYGVGDEAQDVLIEAATWQMDNYGEDLVAVAIQDGALYYWDSSAGGAAAALTNAPTGNVGVVVTPERFVVALGAGGDPRYIRWADQDDRTDWTLGDESNVAGDHNLSTDGEILAARRSRRETLIWTTVGLHSMQYIGGTFVYGFKELGANCGAVSRRSMAVVDGTAVWMGPRGFWLYDGFVKPIASDVADYVFNDINRTQISKVHAEVRSAFGEIWFYYPSGNSTENNRYVVYNYHHGFMYVGNLARTAGVDQGVFANPISADPNGVVYQHEAGNSYLDQNGVALVPSATSGPVELGEGDAILEATNIIPDENTLGGVNITLLSALTPTDARNGRARRSGGRRR